MRRLFLLFLLLILSLSGIASQAAAQIVIDGEPFTKQVIVEPPGNDRLVEFIRDAENLDNWTKLVGYRYQELPSLKNDPEKAALAMAEAAQKANPGARYRLYPPGKIPGEALIDLRTWPADEKYLEFNVYRYARSANGQGVISLHLAYRTRQTTKIGAEQIKKIRDVWIDQAAKFDMGKIEPALGLPPPDRGPEAEPKGN